jgi:thioredoxin-dependent peroxiredoxin
MNIEPAKLNQKVDILSLPLPSDAKHLLNNGKTWTLLVFYPGDFTPVCTKQWCHYRDESVCLGTLPIKVFGVSSGAQAQHQDFADSYKLPFEFIDDESGEIVKAFGMKSTFGFVKRGLALLDPQGVLKYCKSRTLPLGFPSVEEITKIFNSVSN